MLSPRSPACLAASRKTTWRASAVLVTLLTMLLGALAASAEPGRSKAELEQLRESIGELQQQLAAERIREKSVTGELDDLERQLGVLVKQRQMEMAELQRVKTGKGKLERQLRELEKQRLESRDNLVKLVRASYMSGQQSGLKLILNQQNPAETTRALSIFRYLSKARNRRIEAGKKLQRELVATRAGLDRRHQELEALLKRLAHNQAQLDAKRAQRARSLAAIRENLRQNQQQVVLYKQRERELERLLARLRRQSISRQSQPASPLAEDGSQETIALGGFRKYKGDMGAPVSGRITARFGERKPESGLKWEGLMFEAAEGEEVVAIYPGQVVFSDWFRGYGQLMVLDHGDGYLSLYGHNRLLRVDLGASVKAGEGIGEAGASGGLSNAGLYFEIRHNGKPRDPLKWCRI